MFEAKQPHRPPRKCVYLGVIMMVIISRGLGQNPAPSACSAVRGEGVHISMYTYTHRDVVVGGQKEQGAVGRKESGGKVKTKHPSGNSGNVGPRPDLNHNLLNASPVLFSQTSCFFSYVCGHMARAERAVPTNNSTNLNIVFFFNLQLRKEQTHTPGHICSSVIKLCEHSSELFLGWDCSSTLFFYVSGLSIFLC